MTEHEPEHEPRIHVDPIPRDARVFQGQRAGVVTRTIAGAVDYAIVAVLVLVTYAGIGIVQFLLDPRSVSWPTWSLLVFTLVGWAYLFLYLTVAWWTTGRTVGSWLMGVRVVNFRGERLRLVGAVVRSAFCVVFPVGLFWCVVSGANRSVQDVVLRTSAVHDWSTPRTRRLRSEHAGVAPALPPTPRDVAEPQ